MGVPNSLRAMHVEHKGKMTKTNLFTADYGLIEEEPDFNTRDYDRPEVSDHIRNLANAYKAGEELPPLLVSVVDGRMLLRDGYCRRRAVLLAREEGAEIHRLPVQEVKGDEIEQSMVILTSNDGLKLTALERAKVYARLLGMNLTEDEVAARVRKTKTHVQQYLAVYSLPIKLKTYIKDDIVSWSLALEMYNEHGTKAVDILESQLNGNPPPAEVKQVALATQGPGDANEQDRQALPADPAPPKPKQKRITRKSVDAVTGYRSRLSGTLVKTVTDSIGLVVKSLSEAEDDGDHVVVRMPKADAEALRTLYQEILPRPKKNKEEQPPTDESSVELSPSSPSLGAVSDSSYDDSGAFATDATETEELAGVC